MKSSIALQGPQHQAEKSLLSLSVAEFGASWKASMLSIYFNTSAVRSLIRKVSKLLQMDPHSVLSWVYISVSALWSEVAHKTCVRT